MNLSYPATANRSIEAAQCYEAAVFLTSNSKEEFQWWIQDLQIFNERFLIQTQTFLAKRTDASTKGWGEIYQGIPTGG